MESVEKPLRQTIWLGDYEVVEVTALAVSISLGKATIHVHLGDFPHATKRGDKLPLYTELTRAAPNNQTS